MFPLLKLPHTALLNVLSTMDPPELTCLTLLNPRFQHIARRIQWPQKELLIGFNETRIILCIIEPQKAQIVIALTSVDWPKNSEPHRIGEQTFDFGFEFLLHSGRPFINIRCASQDREKVYNILVSHVLHIFRLSPLIECECRLESLHSVPTSQPIGRLDLHPNTLTSAKELDQFINNHPSLDVLTMTVISGTTTSSKFLSVRNLNWFCKELANREILLAFSGHDIILSKVRLSTSDVIALVRHWMDEGYQNLHTMFLLWNTPEFDLDQIKTEFNLNEDRPKKSPARYTRPIRNRDCFQKSIDLFDCTKALDIERESDGQLASFRVLGRHFLFYVWKDQLPME